MTAGWIVSKGIVRSEAQLVMHLMQLVIRIRPLELAQVELPLLIVLIVHVLLILGIPNKTIIRWVILTVSRRSTEAQQSEKSYRQKKRLHWDTLLRSIGM